MLLKHIRKATAKEFSEQTKRPLEAVIRFSCIYDDTVPCNIRIKNNAACFVTDMEFEKEAERSGFHKTEEGEYIKEAEQFKLEGYKSFGMVKLDDEETAYWVCRAASGEDIKLPGKLDYFQISKTEYENKILLTANMEKAAATITVQAARSRYNEEEKIRCGILGIKPKQESSLASLLSIYNDGDETESEDDERDKPERRNSGSSIMGIGSSAAQKFSKMRDIQLPAIRRNKNEEELEDDETEDESAGFKGGNRKLHIPKPALILLIVSVSLLLLFWGAGTLQKKNTGNLECMDLSQYYVVKDKNEVVLVYNGQALKKRGLFAEGHSYVTYDFVRSYLNKRLYYDDKEELMIYVTNDSIIEMHKNSRKAEINGESKQFDIMPYRTTNDGNVWISIDFISQYSAFEYTEYTNPHILVITNYSEDTETSVVKTKKNTFIRYRGNSKSPVLKSIQKGQELTVSGESENGWLKVSSLDGITGYIPASAAGEEAVKVNKKNVFHESFRHNSYTGKILMTWHQVTNTAANSNISEIINEIKGVNVISPTWFYLNDSKGGIADLGSAEYVEICHRNNILVWGLVSNLENPDIDTTDILTHTSKRKQLERNIIEAAKKYNLDGINLDFESLSNETGDSYIQFIREMSILLDGTGIVLSVDNYVPSEYTKLYDREEQAKFADYIVVMAYDEHTASSESPGSTASYPWVREGLENTLKEVPNEQVILGIPLYTRIWKTKDGTQISEAAGMESVINSINEADAEVNWDEDLKQFYAVYKDRENQLCEVWVEETASIAEKLSLMREFNIAGSAFWKVGLEPKTIWDEIIKGYSGNQSISDDSNQIPSSDVNESDSDRLTDAMDTEKNLEEDAMKENEMGILAEDEES